jgi:stage II sporulation protein D
VAATILTFAPAHPAHASVPVLVLDGTGYGHGVGLSQWGAAYLARTGRSTEQILGTFYPGASLGQATGPVRVAVHRPATSTTTLTFPQGGEVRSPLDGDQAPGFPLRLGPGGRVRITFDGAYRLDVLVAGQSTAPATVYDDDPCLVPLLCPTTQPPPPPTTTTTAPSTTAPPESPAPGAPGGAGSVPGGTASAGTVWAVPAQGGATTVDDRGRSYRGVLEATGGGALRLVNQIGVEDYLRGMDEVPGTWPAAAVQAQTIAARTYALRAMAASGELCDDARCQVYVGRTAESPGEDAAVSATAQTVLAYNGALAAAVYSADAGGVSATPFEGFGTPDGVYPYLRSVRYDTDNPLPWHLEVGLGDLGARLGYPGTVTAVRVTDAGPSGRALTVTLDGSAGAVGVDGRTFARSLGLRSTRFTAVASSADAAPPPPPPAEEGIQLLPAETAAPARTPVRPAAGAMIDRRVPSLPTAPVAARPPPGLDPRRHLVELLAGVAVAGVVGAQVPLLLSPARRFGSRPRRARPWPAWSRSTPGR